MNTQQVSHGLIQKFNSAWLQSPFLTNRLLIWSFHNSLITQHRYRSHDFSNTNDLSYCKTQPLLFPSSSLGIPEAREENKICQRAWPGKKTDPKQLDTSCVGWSLGQWSVSQRRSLIVGSKPPLLFRKGNFKVITPADWKKVHKCIKSSAAHNTVTTFICGFSNL